MTLVSWSDKFSINVELIDVQHKKLFELINNLYDQIKAGADNKLIENGLNALVDYTRFHFQEEEELMRKVEYVRYNQHKMEHDKLTKQVIEFKLNLSSGKGDTGDFLKFLYSWLTGHIMEQDRKIGKFLEQKALKPVDKIIY